MKKMNNDGAIGMLMYCSVATTSHRQYFVLHAIRIDERKRFEPLFIAVVGKGGGGLMTWVFVALRATAPWGCTYVRSFATLLQAEINEEFFIFNGAVGCHGANILRA